MGNGGQPSLALGYWPDISHSPVCGAIEYHLPTKSDATPPPDGLTPLVARAHAAGGRVKVSPAGAMATPGGDAQA